MYDWIYWSLLLVFIPLSVSYMAVTLYPLWTEHRLRTRALDVLRVYAEKGEEPPASVAEAFAAVASSKRPPGLTVPLSAPMLAPTRAHHLAAGAAHFVALVGAIGIALWKMPREGEAGAVATWAIVAAIFFAATLVSRLVKAFATPAAARFRDDG